MEDIKYKSNLRTLHVLLILSFIYTGIMFIGELISGMALPWMTRYYAAHPDAVPDEWGILLERSLSIPQWYYFLTALLDAVSIVGMVLMWRLRKNGFHCYTLAKLLLIAMPMLFLSRSFIGIGNIMVCVLMICIYFYLMRALGTFSGGASPTSTGTTDNLPSKE